MRFNWNTLCVASIAILATPLALLLSGCTGGAPASPAAALNTAANAAKPMVDIEQTLERLSPSLLDELTRADMFEPLIAIEDPAKNQPVATTSTPSTPGPATPDPSAGILEGLTLAGVIYSPNTHHSMAILKSEDGDKTQILQQGQSFSPEDDVDTRIQVDRVTRKGAVVTAYSRDGKVLASRGLEVQDLVGYHKKETEKGGATTRSQSSPGGSVSENKSTSSDSTSTQTAAAPASSPSTSSTSTSTTSASSGAN